MITIAALRRATLVTALSAGLCISLSATAVRAADAVPTDEEILKAKCSLCHDVHRISRLTPDQIRPVIERMRKMNPDLITQVESDHIVEVIAKTLNDPGVIAARTAWLESVARGEKLFNDATLGTTGKSCSSCHAQGSLRNVEDRFPKFDPELKRFVDMQEAINRMIGTKMSGTPLPPNDQRYFDLLSYLKSLK